MGNLKVIIILALLLPQFALAKLERLREVDEGVWAGSQPESNIDFQKLVDLGIKVVIDLQRSDDKKVRPEEKKWKEIGGVKFIQIPMVATDRPSDETIKEVFKAIKEAQGKGLPVYFHCTLGRDRTGLVEALYKVNFEGVSAAQAYRGWLKIGFSNRFLKKIDQYFKDVTGFTGPRKSRRRSRPEVCAGRLGSARALR